MGDVIRLSDRRARTAGAPIGAIVVPVAAQQPDQAAAFWLGVAILAETAAAILRGFQGPGQGQKD